MAGSDELEVEVRGRRTSRQKPFTPDEIRETERLEALERLDVLDAPRDEAFDRIVRLVRSVFDVPIATISVIDAHRQLFKAWEGFPGSEVDRGDSFCSHTIRSDMPLVVPDALLDPRFVENPFVTGEPHVRFYAGAPLTTIDGHNIGTICAIDTRPREFGPRDVAILREMADLAMDQIDLRRLASTDPLTGALTRRAFLAAGQRAVALAVRHKHNLSMIAFDVDHFKVVNDRFGHSAGDSVLAGLAMAVTGSVRESEVFGRLGGEEFALLLPHTDRRGAIEVAERLRTILSGLPFEPNGKSHPITASFGVATIDLETQDLEALMSHADAALYEAKAAGRNRVVGWRNHRLGEPVVRRRVLKAGQIHFNSRRSTVDCTVRTLGEEGAGLDLSSSYGLPETFGLRIRADNFDRPCRVISQSERHVEVEFC